MPSPIIDSQVRPATAAPSAGQLPDEVVRYIDVDLAGLVTCMTSHPEAMDAVVESHMVIGGLLNVIREGVEPTDMSTTGNVPLAVSLCQTARNIQSGRGVADGIEFNQVIISSDGSGTV